MNRPLITKRKRVNDFVGKSFFFILLPSFFGLIAGWIYLTIPDRYQSEVDFRARALLTSGVITQIQRPTTCTGGFAGGCTSYCSVTIRFKTNTGKTVIFSQACPSSVRKNQTVPVLYEPNALDSTTVKARIDRWGSPESLARSNLITSLVVALFGISSLVAGFLIYRTNQTQT
jgi:hypothetical protein